jgi:hypothetical protein
MSGSDNKASFSTREMIALLVLLAGILGIVILAWVAIAKLTEQDDIKFVFSSVLPIFAGWVGTVLAFYFTKENYEAANRSLENTVKNLTSSQKLEGLLVSECMILFSKMKYESFEESDYAGKTIHENIIGFMNENKKNRLPIIDSKKYPKFIIHKSLAEKFISDKALGGSSSEELKALSLKELIDDTELGKIIKESFITVKKDVTMKSAKDRLEDLANEKSISCQDVFVTEDGTRDSAVIGWLTNVDISKASQV